MDFYTETAADEPTEAEYEEMRAIFAAECDFERAERTARAGAYGIGPDSLGWAEEPF